MPETVRAEIIAMGAERAVHTTARNMRRAFVALAAAIVLLMVSNLTGMFWQVQANKAIQHREEISCRDRQERVEATRSLWNAVFDELESLGGSDPTLDRLQIRVDKELPPLEC